MKTQLLGVALALAINARHMIVATAAALVVAVAGPPANASIIYQSIPVPDMTATPEISWCSTCPGISYLNEGLVTQLIGQQFSLGSAATALSVTFAVQIYQGTPSSVTLGFYQDLGGTVGSNIYDQTFSSSQFVAISPGSQNSGQPTELITVNLATGVPLATGNYLLFMTNPTYLAIPAFGGLGSGGQIVVEDTLQTPLPQTGDQYLYPEQGVPQHLDSAVYISDTLAPVPAALPLFATGLGVMGLFGWRRKRKNAAAIGAA